MPYGLYTERGIKERDGYGSERFRVEPQFAVKVDASLGDLGVLLEPASVVAKAWDHAERIGARSSAWSPRSSPSLITGDYRVYTQATMNRKPLRATLLFAALTFVSASAAFAQSMPNLAGTWLLNFDKSGERIAGNGADVPFPSQMVIAQSPTELTVERTSVRQDGFKAVYKFDGSRVNVAAPEGISETAEAKFDGATLVITSRRSFSSPAGDTVIDFREVWTVKGNELTVQKTVTQDGGSDTETAVYDKK